MARHIQQCHRFHAGFIHIINHIQLKIALCVLSCVHALWAPQQPFFHQWQKDYLANSKAYGFKHRSKLKKTARKQERQRERRRRNIENDDNNNSHNYNLNIYKYEYIIVIFTAINFVFYKIFFCCLRPFFWILAFLSITYTCSIWVFCHCHCLYTLVLFVVRFSLSLVTLLHDCNKVQHTFND